MNLSQYIDSIITDNKNYRIGYGIRDSKTHKPIKFFSNLHFYQELTKFKTDEQNLKNLESNTWKITNEYKNKYG